MVQASSKQRTGPDRGENAGLVSVEHVSCRFGPTVALDDVSVQFRAGEAHALMGENGAGKSTLGKIIAGLHRQDSGQVVVAGRPLQPGSIIDAFNAGVRIVHQELAQCPSLSVAENLCLHSLPRQRGAPGAIGIVDRRSMRARAESLLRPLEPAIDVDRPLGSLSPGHRQIVQIAAALEARGGGPGAAAGSEPRAIVFDEPTSSLSIAEVERLMGIIRRLTADGLAVIYVSHRMAEIFQLCDRVTVLRDGRFVATTPIGDIDEPALGEQMIGRRLEVSRRPTLLDSESATFREMGSSTGAVPGNRVAEAEAAALVGERLDIRRVSSPGRLGDISLTVEPGEILGLGGLVGAGRSELLDAVFGLDPMASGEVSVGGRLLDRHSPRAAIAAGVGYVPEDRKLQGLFFQIGVGENIVLPLMGRLAGRLGFRRPRPEQSLIDERIRALGVKAASWTAQPDELSGGNQQKLLIARWIGRGTRVLLLDEPTRGIDVGTKSQIHRIIRDAARAGAAVLLVSSEMPELLALSDRIIVLREGRVAGELRGDAMTQGAILRLATGSIGPVRRPA